MGQQETLILNAILNEFATRPDMRLWKCVQGYGTPPGGTHPVRFGGPSGCADLSGILAGGRRIEIEVKTQEGRQSLEQRNWGAMIQTKGGIYIVARSVYDVYAGLESQGVVLPRRADVAGDGAGRTPTPQKQREGI